MNCHHVYEVIGAISYVFIVWSRRFLPVVGGQLQFPFVGPQREPLITQSPTFDKWSLLYPVGYIVDCYELVVYRRQCLIFGSSLLIMLTVLLVIGIWLHCLL
jgi:hypothetical protein